MTMYTLNPPTKVQDGMWHIKVLGDSGMYLRPNLSVKTSTGYIDRHNVGFWPTEELAWKAYRAYYAKHKPKRIFTTSKG